MLVRRLGVASLSLIAFACSSQTATEPTAATDEAITRVCPVGYVPDCVPEYVCFRPPPYCVIRNVCTCVPSGDPFPIPFPQMPTGGGTVMQQLDLVTVSFQGHKQSDGKDVPTLVADFGSTIGSTAWIQTITKSYRTGSSPFAVTNKNIVMPPYVSGTIDPVALVTGLLNNPANGLSASTPGLLFEVFLPSAACGGGNSRHDHFAYGTTQVAYAVSCGDLPFGGNNVGPSHELAEAITDPFFNGYTFSNLWPSVPWAQEGEVGDACEGMVAHDPAYSFPLATIWSNNAAAAGGSPCVPAPSLYFNVSPSGPLAWDQWNTTPISMTPGSTVKVTVTGWTYPSTAQTWPVTLAIDPNSGTWLTGSISASTISTNGSVTLTFHASPSAPTNSNTRGWAQVVSTLNGAQTVWPLSFVVP